MAEFRVEELKYIQAVADRASAFIEPAFGPNSCIPTARILVDTLEALGTKARALVPRRAVQSVPAAGTSKCTGPSVVGWSQSLARLRPLPSGRER